jgi:hypothetical protein
MSIPRLPRKFGLVCLIGAGFLTAGSPGRAGPFGYYDGCCHQKCPPKFVHCQEGPPCIKWKCGCPKPVCNPCDLPHFGYYRPCWQPWPFPPDWSHCLGPIPGTPHDLPVVMGNLAPAPDAGTTGPGTTLPSSRRPADR